MDRFGWLVLLACAAPAHADTALLSGSFVHFGYSSTDEQLPAAQLPLFLDELRDLGNDTLIIGQTRATRAGVGCASSAQDFEWIAGFPAKLGTVLDAAAAWDEGRGRHHLQFGPVCGILALSLIHI